MYVLGQIAMRSEKLKKETSREFPKVSDSKSVPQLSRAVRSECKYQFFFSR